MKFLISFFLFYYFINFIKSESLTWIDQSNSKSFSDITGWNPSQLPTSLDDTTINNGASVFESLNDISVKSLLLDSSSSLLVNNNIFFESPFITLRSTSTFEYYFIYSYNVNLYDSSKLLPLLNNEAGIGRLNSTVRLKAEFYDNSQFYALYSSQKDVVVQGDFNFYNQSTLKIKNINFNIYEDSTLNFNDKSKMYLDTCLIPYNRYNKVIFNNDSSGLITNIGYINDLMLNLVILNGNSNVSMIDNFWVAIKNIEMFDNSFILVNNSVLALEYNITMYDKTSMIIEKTNFYTYQNMVSRVRNLEIIGSGGLSNNANFYSEGDYLIVREAGMISAFYGDLHLNATVSKFRIGFATSYFGNIHIHKRVEGFVANIVCKGGNLIVHPNSYTYLNHSLVVVRDGGKLFISEEAIFMLYATEVRNENGTLSTSGSVYVSPGSSIYNDDQFIIQSNIIESNKLSNIPFINTGVINLNGNISSSGSSGINKSNIKNVDSNEGNSSDNELNEIILQVNLDNSGTIKIEKNQHVLINKYTQSNESAFLVIDNSTISSNQTILFNQGTIYGNGTFNSSLTQDAGEFGSRNQTIYFDINGNYTLNSNGTILIIINSYQEFSKINILKNANISGNVEIRVLKDLVSNEKDEYQKELNIINYSNLDSNGFNSIKFKTYDPVTGKEEDRNEDSCLKSNTSKTSFSILIGCKLASSSSSLSGGAIAGIVVGCAVAVILVGSLIHYKKRIYYKVEIKLRELSKK